jgi:hypothetical protein
MESLASRERLLVDAAIVAAVHAAGCALVLALGFDHVSDDDYARVTIAQSFAHAPRLDPSGTSWLPFPFWTLGIVMAIFGRSLAVARATAIVLASAAAAVPYVAARMTGATRNRALAGVAFALASPWSLWLGAATVPESVTASLTAGAVIALGASTEAGAGVSSRARAAFAVGLFCACLSRYEVWPVAAVLATVLAVRATRGSHTPTLLLALLVALGPLVWIAWNMHAHDDPLHFFQRVSRFKRAIGEGSHDTASALLSVPRLLVTMRPDVVVAAASALATTRAFASVHDELRRRWVVPLGCVAAQIAFLAFGNARDGAPAHHAERALLGAVFVLAWFAGDLVVMAWPLARQRRRGLALGAGLVVLVAWIATGAVTFRDVPGSGAADDRSAQLAAGKKLRDDAAEHVELTPCAFEHFALIAAFTAPERVTTQPSSGAPVERSCPAIERR